MVYPGIELYFMIRADGRLDVSYDFYVDLKDKVAGGQAR